jgi:hypothetical protein
VLTDNAANGLANRVERSRFLKRLGGVTLAGVTATLVRPQAAFALWESHGCQLCFPPPGFGGPSCPDLTCVWCWIGDPHSFQHGVGSCKKHYCCEGNTNQNCSANCSGVVCSWLSGTYEATGC